MYYYLKFFNFSFYMFYIKDSDFIFFGVSFESVLKYNVLMNMVEIYFIVGICLRGKDK